MKSKVMRTAWNLFRMGVKSFSDALKMAWANVKAELAAKREAGITEETHTWYGWKELGYEVTHESKALFKAVLADLKTRSGSRVVAYFGASQVKEVLA